VPNVFHNAQAACQQWLSGSLWGNPIKLSHQNIHIYGIWKRRWQQVFIQFTQEHIVIVRPPNQRIQPTEYGGLMRNR
jgi:hypothetical protein